MLRLLDSLVLVYRIVLFMIIIIMLFVFICLLILFSILGYPTIISLRILNFIAIFDGD